MLFITNAEMDCVEKMVTRYIEKTVYGVRADYFRKAMKIHRIETSLDTISELEELDMSQAAVCGHCASCPKESLCMAMDELTEKQVFVITRIFIDRLTEKEVADELGITQQAEHFQKNKALAKLRSLMLHTTRGG